jgi:iron complex outermembrane receptor protein
MTHGPRSCSAAFQPGPCTGRLWQLPSRRNRGLGEIGSSFFSKGSEGRIELIQPTTGAGAEPAACISAAQCEDPRRREILPDSRQKQTGLFTLQTYVDGPIRIADGARVEFSKLNADEDDQLGTPERSLDFTTLSGSLGGQYEFVPNWRAGLSLSHSERAPAIDELFANGPHGGSQSFEVGNPDLDPERSNSSSSACTTARGGCTSPPTCSTAGSPTSSSRRRPARSRTTSRCSNIVRQGNYYRFEAQAEMKFGNAGHRLGRRAAGRRGPCNGQGFRPGAADPPMRLTGTLTGEKGQFGGGWRLNMRSTMTAPRAQRDRHRRLYDGQCLDRLAPVRGEAPS